VKANAQVSFNESSGEICAVVEWVERVERDATIGEDNRSHSGRSIARVDRLHLSDLTLTRRTIFASPVAGARKHAFGS
jgi:hypothetical protein